MNYYIYLTTNLITGKQYVGERSTNKLPEEDNYIGSGKLFKIKVKEYGRNNFKKQIIDKSFNSKQEAFDAQEKYIIQFNTLVPNGYNISPKGGLGVQGWITLSDETKQKISKACLGKNKGIKRTEEQKLHLKNINTGKKQSKDTANKRSASLMGHRSWSKGQKRTEETKNLISLNNAKTMLGKHHSEKAKEKNRQAHLGKIPWNKGLKLS